MEDRGGTPVEYCATLDMTLAPVDTYPRNHPGQVDLEEASWAPMDPAVGPKIGPWPPVVPS